MPDFLECQKTYSCPSQPIRLPFDLESGDRKYEGYAFSPFVKLEMVVANEYITVGNQSRPNAKNTAVITSLEYGASEGMGCTIEITDEEGGNFTKSFDAINKGLGSLEKDISGFKLDFGWIVEKKCGNQSNVEIFSVNSVHKDYIHLLPIRMNVIYEGGKIKYVLEAQDMMTRVSETRQECNLGRDDKKVPLKQAILEFMKKELPPPFLDVKFLDKDGKEWNFANINGGKEGPRGVWGSCQQNKLATLRRWISGFRTSNGKGIVFQWEGIKSPVTSAQFSKDRTDPLPVLVLLEDPSPDRCQESPDLCSNNVATYIVNGGNKSPVISFNPSVNWTFAPSAGSGGGLSGNTAEGQKKDGKLPGCKGNETKDSAGISSKSGSDHSRDQHSTPEQGAKDANNADTAHQAANAARELLSPIQAELKIVGDPFFVFPMQFVIQQVSLIVLNPYHLRATSNSCVDWLAEPTCNPVFSNKGWDIMGVNHQIREGSYVTILKLQLPVPNVQLPPESPLGGDPSGYKVEIKTEPKKEGKCFK